MPLTIALPSASGAVETYQMGPPARFPARSVPFNRQALAALHVVPDISGAYDPWQGGALDWDATLSLRHRIWDLGLGVAEAMDTAQRGMGLAVADAMELNRRSILEARARKDQPVLFCGVGTDALADGPQSLDAILSAYEAQMEAVERDGGRVVLMASRALAAAAQGPEDYARVYDRLLAGAAAPVIIHWLGEMFDPALQGYWGHADHYGAMDVVLDLLPRHALKTAGVKLSLLDADKEIALRARLPDGVRMFTGDDFNYVSLIEGADGATSDALLGAFDMAAPAASAALGRLAAGDIPGWRAILQPTEALARHVFAAPTRYYKTGVVFLAWLYGWQRSPLMLGGQESARSILHLAECFRLADRAGLFADPDRAASRMETVLAVHGIGS